MVMELLPPPALSVFVPGIPRPQGSKNYLGNGRAVEASKYLPAWRTDVRDTLIAEWQGKAAMTGGIVMHLQFVMPRPKNMPKNRPTRPHLQKPDYDKLARAIGDAATSAQVYKDDCYVIESHIRKRFAEIDEVHGCWIHLWEA